jgi:flagellar biosynthesis protein FlhA
LAELRAVTNVVARSARGRTETAARTLATTMTLFARFQDLLLPVALISSLLVVLVPLPSAIVDALLAANITVSVIILLTTVYVRTPLEFNIVPSVLLATTLGRLVMNVASTRLR